MGAVVSKESIQTDDHESLHARARKFGKNKNTQLTSAVGRHVVAAEPFVHTQPDSRFGFFYWIAGPRHGLTSNYASG